jgi:putative transposase
MPRYVRAHIAGGVFFFTVVTNGRRPLFRQEAAREALRQAWQETERSRPFETIAFCLLPDHIHALWQLPEGDADFSRRWAQIKARFSRIARGSGRPGNPLTSSARPTREAGFWQRRFWEHAIRAENDLERHMDYIHYNPVKHGLASDPADWEWSTFHRYVAEGWYPEGWGRLEPDGIQAIEEAGE